MLSGQSIAILITFCPLVSYQWQNSVRYSDVYCRPVVQFLSVFLSGISAKLCENLKIETVEAHENTCFRTYFPRDRKHIFLHVEMICKRIFLPVTITRRKASETKKAVQPSCVQCARVRACFRLLYYPECFLILDPA